MQLGVGVGGECFFRLSVFPSCTAAGGLEQGEPGEEAAGESKRGHARAQEGSGVREATAGGSRTPVPRGQRFYTGWVRFSPLFQNAPVMLNCRYRRGGYRRGGYRRGRYRSGGYRRV